MVVPMNKMLEQAIARLAMLPEAEQEAYGLQLLAEMESERGWDERFAKSQDMLGALAAQARSEAARGDVLPYDPSDRPAQ
ncbi:conserved protein of unknown function [Magnetospirillum sp. XM-1]|uniref:hypothetical protein n=1 Tax=Magnetospirillum sp. XM-1 TaxID=1663591 RepID=UPI00073DFA32|nr:hypothetical protein [Magnetospirillum sp. XM-1]CUW39063.1 conserved protein of unknown function [Magnetospirillum sp. XM-1]